MAQANSRAETGAEDSIATSGEWGAADEAAVEVSSLQARLARLRALDDGLGALGKKSQVRAASGMKREHRVVMPKQDYE